MDKTNVGALLLGIAATLGGTVGGPIAIDKVIAVRQEPVTAVEISGPDVAEVGELVLLTLSGNSAAWRIPAAIDVFEVDDNSRVLSFREPGTYTVIASASADGDTTIIEHVITVLGPPEPVVVDDPEPVTPALTDLVRSWCVETNAPKDACFALGSNFVAASSEASTNDMLTVVSKSNRELNQAGCVRVLARIQRYLFDNLSGKSVADHQQAFAQIGEGLLSYGR